MRRLRTLIALAAIVAAGSASGFEPEFVPGHVLTWQGGTATYRVNAQSFTAAQLSDSVITASFNAWANDALANLTLNRGSNVTGTANQNQSSDGINEVELVTSGWVDGSGVLGVTYVYFDTSTDRIAEADMYLNGQHFDWDDPASAGCPGRFDLGATVTHEAGHFIGLGHSSEQDATCNTFSPSYDPVLCDATMFYAGGPCDTSGQSLECDDLAGLRYLYPPSGTRRADWVAESFSALPAPGPIASGASVAVTGTARNSGSLATSVGVAAVYVTTAPGSIAGGRRLGVTDGLGNVEPCRSEGVSLAGLQFAPGDAGQRWLVVRLDDGTSTNEYDESSNNLASIGPFTVSTASPVLVVAPDALEFDAATGGAAPASQPVAITNGGAGSFTWTASDDQAWISLSRTSGAPGQGFDVSITTTGLAAGRHVGTITVTAPGASGSPETIAVGLDLTSGPILAVAPSSLTFAASPNGAAPPAQQLAVSNTGGGTLAWTTSDDQPWMSVTPPSGTNAGNATVTITTTNLAVGTYTGTVTVTAGGAAGSPRAVPVTYEVSSAPPVLDVAPASLTFAGAVGSSPAPQSLAITNTGGGSLAFTAASNRSWLNASPSAGTAPGSVSVSVSTAGLAAGTHDGIVTITSAGAQGSPRAIPVTLSLTTQPVLSAAPGTLAFATAAGSSPAAKTLTIANAGSGSLTYSIADDSPWLSLSPSTGATLAASATRAHQVSVDATGLPEGSYQATITAIAVGVQGSPQVVAVTLDVGARPALVVGPATLAFTATGSVPDPPAQSISIGTSGASGAAWTAVSDAAWLTVAPGQGIGDGTVSVRASSAGLADGPHSGHVTITSAALAASPQRVDVTLTVAPGPRLTASPLQVRWTATRGEPSPAPQSLVLGNAGSGTLSWSISGTPGWLQVTPSSGTGPATVTLAPTTTDLPPGRLAAGLTVTATGAYGSPTTVEVLYDVLGPALAFAPERVRFELSEGAFVGASSAGVAIAGATWTAASNAPWLSVSPPSGAAGESVTVLLVQPERLRPGVHDAAVIFTSTGAANSPAPVPVTVVVRQPPGLSVHPSSLDLVAIAGAGVQAAGTLAIDESGDREGDWSLGATPSWLRPQAASGRSGARLGLAVDPSGLAPGTHSGTLVVLSGGETQGIPVSVTILAAPAFRAAPASVELLARAGGTSSSVTLSIDNKGAGPGSFTASGDAAWLRVSPGSGSAPGALSVSADAASLPAGTYRGTVTAGGASGEDATVPVTLTVVPALAALARVTQDAASGCAPLTVTFTDASDGATARTWRLPDGTTRSAPAIQVTFAEAGEHVVELVASGAGGSSAARASVVVRQPPLSSAGPDRVVAFEPDGESLIALESARAIAAAPASVASLQWTTSRGAFQDTGTATSALERPVLALTSGRGGLAAVVTLSVADDAGCVATDAATIRVRADVDLDGDTWNELVDNCPGLANSLQGDQDGDGRGSTCDTCPFAFDPSAVDADGSGFGDACEPAGTGAVALSTIIGGACSGEGPIVAEATSPGRVRRLALTLTGRAAIGAEPLGAAAAAGGSAVLSQAVPGRAELRVPAGVPASSARLSLLVPLFAADDVVDVPCAGATLGFAESAGDAACAGGEVRLRPDADVAPSGAPNGTLDVGDVVRMLRASVGLETLSDEEVTRADLAPGVAVAGAWDAAGDCRIDVGDVVIGLRAAVGLVTLPR